jgi:DNA polymerase-3 subunit delta
VKATRQTIGRAVDQPNPDIVFYLFYGADNAQSRALAERLLTALGATRFLVSSAAVKSDPAVLADEAGAMSLFGGPRAIWVEPAGDEIVPAVEALLEAAALESPVIVVAGGLRKTSALVKLAEGAQRALGFAAYAPEGADAERMVTEVGRTFGLKVDGPVAARVAGSCGNDQAVVAQELAKLALYLDASPHSPKTLDHDSLDAVGAELPGANAPRLADLALAGDVQGLNE